MVEQQISIAEQPDIESSTLEYASRFSGEIGEWLLSIQCQALASAINNDNGKKYMAFTGVGKRLAWDGDNMKITNYEPANQFVSRTYRDF